MLGRAWQLLLLLLCCCGVWRVAVVRCYGGSRGRASQACSRRGGRKAQYGHAGHQTTPPYSLTNLSLSHTVLLHSLFCFNCFLSNVVSLVHLLPTNFFSYTCLPQKVQFIRKLSQ